MLTADQLDAFPDPIIDLYEEYQQSVINDIARRLAKMDVTSTAAWQMQRLVESGAVYENALKELSRLTGKSEAALRALFERAGVKALRFDDSIYRAAGLNPLPLNLSPAMAQVLAAGLRKTQGVMQNLTMTTAVNGQEAFIQAADLAYMQVSSGAMSYTQAIRDAVIGVTDQGLSAINYASGRREQLDVAMRRTVLTGVSQTAGQLQIARADEMGSDLVQTSAHVGARPEHQVWQGQIFSRSGNSKEYPNFVASTGYGTGAGLCGWNCRHSFYPYFEGISENAYSKAELESYANKTVTYQGQEISMYDATQKQRAIERKIRFWKRRAGALDAAGLDSTVEGAKVREWQAQMRDFTKQTGLIRQRERERVLSTPSLESMQGKPLTVEQLINVAANGKRALTHDELGQVVEHVAGVGFDPMPNARVLKKYDGLIVNGQTLRTGDRVPTGYIHFAKHVIDNGEWPAGTSYEDYIKSLERVASNPKTGILLSRYPQNELQLTLFGKGTVSSGAIKSDIIIVNYRVSRGAWMTGHYLTENLDEFLKSLGETKWLRPMK